MQAKPRNLDVVQSCHEYGWIKNRQKILSIGVNNVFFRYATTHMPTSFTCYEELTYSVVTLVAIELLVFYFNIFTYNFFMKTERHLSKNRPGELHQPNLFRSCLPLKKVVTCHLILT